MKELNAKSLVSWEDQRFKEYNVGPFFEQTLSLGINVHQWNQSIGDENIHITEQADVGLTFADLTLAESGTVVLFSDHGKGRSVSLLPTNYIAIIPKSVIVPRLTQATSYIHRLIVEDKRLPSRINFISGPSNSADIEMNLVVGVHGPVRAYYIIVTDQ
jgi:L-lactate dehydrogenase complex protein LldG